MLTGTKGGEGGDLTTGPVRTGTKGGGGYSCVGGLEGGRWGLHVCRGSGGLLP